MILTELNKTDYASVRNRMEASFPYEERHTIMNNAL